MCFGFFDECPEYDVLEKELDDEQNASSIHFSVYKYQGRYETHVIIPNGPSVCIICECNDDINNVLVKRPTYGNKTPLQKCHIILVTLKGTLSTNVK